MFIRLPRLLCICDGTIDHRCRFSQGFHRVGTQRYNLNNKNAIVLVVYHATIVIQAYSGGGGGRKGRSSTLEFSKGKSVKRVVNAERGRGF